jgi:hypothetical protein
VETGSEGKREKNRNETSIGKEIIREAYTGEEPERQELGNRPRDRKCISIPGHHLAFGSQYQREGRMGRKELRKGYKWP